MEWGDWFYYDELSPTSLKWAVQRHGGLPNNRILVIDVGDVAGCITVHGYGEVKLNGVSYKVHRIVYEMFFDVIPDGMDVDHIDGDRLNNAPNNLRLVKDKQNAQNKSKRCDNTSGTTGVTRIRNRSKNCELNYWLARWTDKNGRECSKSFRIDKLGDEEAFRLACQYREAMLKKLVAQGEFYTERHGKDLVNNAKRKTYRSNTTSS